MKLLTRLALSSLLVAASLLLSACGGSGGSDSTGSDDAVFKSEMEGFYTGAKEVYTSNGGYFTSDTFTAKDLAAAVEKKESQLKPIRVVKTKADATGPGVCIIATGTEGKNLYASDCDGTYVKVTDGGKPVYSGEGA